MKDHTDKKEPGLSRRGFLKASAAGLALPYFVPSTALAQAARPGVPARRGANDRINIGVIGTGGMGQNHVLEDTVALCDVDANHLANAAKKVKGTPFLCRDYREMLDRSDVDAVMIAAPDHWHALMTVHACQAGKDVYSEKPTCRTIQEGQAMVNAANRYGRVVQIGAQGRSHPHARAAAQFIRNGQIGRVKNVEIWHPNNFTGGGWGEEKAPPPELDWGLWLGPARWRPYNPQIAHFNFRWMMDFGGGFIRDRGNHVLSLVMWCLNADHTGPVSVEATGTPDKDGVWDAPVSMDVRWEFRDPDWTLTWNQPGKPRPFPGGTSDIEWGAQYFGDRDSLIIANGDGGCGTEEKALQYKPPAYGTHLFQSPGHRENWLDCIRTRERPVMPVDVGHRVVSLAIIANISYVLGRKLRWNPLTERFFGDDEANRFLAQPYRAPWHL